MDLLAQTTLHPLLQDWEVDHAQQTMHFQALQMMPEMVLSETLQAAAYGTDQQLGKPHFCELWNYAFIHLFVYLCIACLLVPGSFILANLSIFFTKQQAPWKQFLPYHSNLFKHS